jgi:hypothetical protein
MLYNAKAKRAYGSWSLIYTSSSQSSGSLHLLLGTHCAPFMPPPDSTASPLPSGPETVPSTVEKPSSHTESVRAEERVLPDGSPAAKEQDASTAKPEHPSCSCPGLASGRNLVVCIDGTANQFSEKVSTSYLHSCHRVLMPFRIRMLSSFTVVSLMTIINSPTTTVGLGHTLESPRLQFVTGNKLSTTVWIWLLHGAQRPPPLRCVMSY